MTLFFSTRNCFLQLAILRKDQNTLNCFLGTPGRSLVNLCVLCIVKFFFCTEFRFFIIAQYFVLVKLARILIIVSEVLRVVRKLGFPFYGHFLGVANVSNLSQQYRKHFASQSLILAIKNFSLQKIFTRLATNFKSSQLALSTTSDSSNTMLVIYSGLGGFFVCGGGES